MSDFDDEITWPRSLEQKVIVDVDTLFDNDEPTMPEAGKKMIRAIECKCGRFDLGCGEGCKYAGV